MRVTFGLRLDERQGPLDQSLFAAPILGRLGLLGLLETHLGLAGPDTPRAQRVAAYLGHLRRLDDGKRFYSASLAADEVGTAAELLSWRDEWRLGGWKGDAPVGAPRRVKDMADVEASAAGHLAPGEAERLAEVVQALTAYTLPIDSIQLLDPLDEFPCTWREALACLPCVPPPELRPGAVGQLLELQAIAVDSVVSGKVASTLNALSDGSVVVVQSQSRETAEHWLSAWCRPRKASRLVLCESGGTALDSTLRATGASACGFDEPSALRPALQTLGLALEMCWTPLDVGRTVEFLLHPFGPFSRSARFKLAKAFAEQPGIDSEAWNVAKGAIAEMDGGPDIVAEINLWLESERWTRNEGVPLAAVSTRVERIRQALQRRLQRTESDVPAVGPAVQQCSAVLESLLELERQGVLRLFPRQIEQLLAQATTNGASNPLVHPEDFCWKSAASAAVCSVEPAQEVIWWMPSTPRLPQPLQWSAEEVESLMSAGVEVRDPQREIEALAKQWLRPLLAATERFVLVLPPPGEEEHPIWQLIKQIVPAVRPARIDDDLYVAHRGDIADVLLDSPLPTLKRYLTLPGPIASRRERQSYSSLSEFFSNPAVSALKDAAALSVGVSVAVDEDNRLLGTLAHRVVEKFFGESEALSSTEQKVVGWFDSMIGQLVESEGAPLLMQGAGVNLHRFKRTCLAALLNLLEHLRSAGAVGVSTEVELQGSLGDVPLLGKIDLVVELPGARTAALDLKWSSTKRYADTLKEGRHLQLGLYAALLQESRGSPPAALGYYIFDTRTLLTTSAGVFPQAKVCPSKSGITLEGLLTQARKSWEWRSGQWAEGVVEVVDERLAAMSDFQGEEGVLQVAALGPWNREYVALLGWSES